MNPSEAFIRAIAENPYDDTPRLIFADWLEEHGDPVRAEFIRIQCELEPIRDQYEIDRAAELHPREEKLRWEHQKQWLGEMPTGWDDWRTGASVAFRRGFVDTLSMPVRTFLDLGPEIRRLAIPTKEWYQHKERMQQHLIDTIGFRPGFIRIRDCQFPGDEYGYDRPYQDDWDPLLGIPDSDDEEAWEEEPTGNGGEISRQIRQGEYILGWDRYADKRGSVHST